MKPPRGLALAVTFATLSAAAVALAADPPMVAGTQSASRPSLFISPSGQPFRAGPGEPYPVARWFAQADRNGDGRIDRAEFRADAAAFFATLDQNHDGVIDGFELSDYEHKIVPEILGAYLTTAGPDGGGAGHHHRPLGGGSEHGGRRGAGDDGGSGGAVMGGAEPYELISEPEPVASADTDLTGRVTLAQFLAAADRRFDRLDTKHQGYLTLADLPKTPVQRTAEGRAGRKSAP